MDEFIVVVVGGGDGVAAVAIVVAAVVVCVVVVVASMAEVREAAVLVIGCTEDAGIAVVVVRDVASAVEDVVVSRYQILQEIVECKHWYSAFCKSMAEPATV